MAQRGINKVIILGRLGQEPDVRYTASSEAIATLTVATSETWRDKQTGETKEKTEWHRVVLFGKVAEVAGEYLRKGSQVYIEGKLQTRKWTDQAGTDRYTTEIVVSMGGTMQMIGSPNDGQQQGSQQRQQQGNQQRQQQGGWGQTHMPQNGQQQQMYTGGGPQQQQQQGQPQYDFDDDIPF